MRHARSLLLKAMRLKLEGMAECIIRLVGKGSFMVRTEAQKRASANWRKNHPEDYRRRQNDWRKRNPEKVRTYRKKFRVTHPDKVKAESQRYREKHREKLRADRKRRYQKHPYKDWTLEEKKKHAENACLSKRNLKAKREMEMLKQ